MNSWSKFSEWLRRLSLFLHRDAATRDLEEEMRLHVELRAEAVRRAQDGGAPSLHDGGAQSLHESAEAIAHRKFGNVTNIQQRSRDAWGFQRIDIFSRDVKFAVRRLVQRPAYALAVVGTMAVGIGVTTSMFSAVDAALLRPLPFSEPRHLVVVPASIPYSDPSFEPHAGDRDLELADVRALSDVFAHASAYASTSLDIAEPSHAVRVRAGVVTVDFFRTMGISPIAGRTFLPAEGVPGAPDVAVISEGLWRRGYGGRKLEEIGIQVGMNRYQVVGIVPNSFAFPRQSEMWIPMSEPRTSKTSQYFKNGISLTVVARLRDGVTSSEAREKLLGRWSQMLHREYGENSARIHAAETAMRERQIATPLQTVLAGDRSTALWVLFGATGLLLLVASVNVTGLLLSSGVTREREFAVRQVLGATRLRIVSQLLTEGMLLGLAGALMGLGVASPLLDVLRTLLPVQLAGVSPAQIDTRVLAFSTSLAIFTGLVCSLWPAYRSARADSGSVIKRGDGNGATATGNTRIRRMLVAGELSLTVVLLVGAGLMLQSFRQLMNRETGMLPENVGTLEFSFANTDDSAHGRLARIDAILLRLNETPGIVAAGVVNDLPLGGGGGLAMRIRVPGAQQFTSHEPEDVMTRWLSASDGYFKAMGIRLIAGRLPRVTDDSAGAQVAVISARMAKAYWPSGDALGRTLYTPSPKARPITVIGIVNDVRESSLEEAPMMQMYRPVHETNPSSVALVVRSSLGRDALLGRMTEAVRSVDSRQAVYNVRMMEEVVSTSVAPRRTNTVLITIFAGLALLLATLGVFAVVSYGVSHRRRELGIRSALGASGAQLATMISREMLWVAFGGVATGVVAAWSIARAIQSLVYGVDVHDPITFLVVAMALLMATALATAIPARLALRVNPAHVMRAE